MNIGEKLRQIYNYKKPDWLSISVIIFLGFTLQYTTIFDFLKLTPLTQILLGLMQIVFPIMSWLAYLLIPAHLLTKTKIKEKSFAWWVLAVGGFIVLWLAVMVVGGIFAQY